jgi:5'-nucleotidase / UDP-sugar diphosphatase
MRGKPEYGWGWGWGVLALACSAPAPADVPATSELTLLHTSDVHSRLWPFRDRISPADAELGLGAEGELAEVGGAARLATLLSEERRAGAGLWLDSGDLLEGAPVFGRYGGAVEVELWGALGVAAMALGNHELSLDGPELERLFGRAKFPVLAANLLPSRAASWLTPSATVLAGSTALAVVGCGTPGSPPSLAADSNPWGLSVIDAAAGVQGAVDALASRTALVVVLSHLGLEADRQLVRETSGVDLVLGGHQHVLTREPEWQEDCATRQVRERRGCSPRRVPIVHSGAYGRYLSKVELRLRPSLEAGGALEVQSATLTHLPLSDSVAEDESTAARLEPYRAAPEPPIGYLPQPLRRDSPLGADSPLGNFVADAVQAETGADIVLLNGSGLRDDLEAGPLLAGDLELAFPFEEPWRLAWLSGWELRVGLDRAARQSASRGCSSTLQLAGMWLRVRCAACGDDLTECWRAGRGDVELRDDERLLVALPQYLALPGANFEEAGPLGAQLSLSVSQVLRRRAARAPRLRETQRCAGELQRATPPRCAEAFGPWCPVEEQRAYHLCSGLPSIEGARDGRIEMLP